jgi:hypothetical protein
MDEQEQAIANAITQFVREAIEQDLTGPTPWTSGIYLALANLGRARGFGVACTPHGDAPEWLYDVTWYAEEGVGPTTRLRGLPMVAECEWNLYGIGDDFEKLLVANAETRVFICNPPAAHQNELMDYFNDSIQGFQQNRQGDRYLIAFIQHDAADPRFEVLVKQ